jgi:hypothetical protein
MKSTILICIALSLACHRVHYREPISMEGVQFVAHARLSGQLLDSVEVWLTIRNTLPYAHEFRAGGCVPFAQFTSASVTKGQIVHKWDYYAMETADYKKVGMVGGACLASLTVGYFPAGHAQTQMIFAIPVNKVLGDSLPMGAYAVTLILPLEGVAPLPAGVVDLTGANSRMRP